jgi:hypothetical protein
MNSELITCFFLQKVLAYLQMKKVERRATNQTSFTFTQV